MKAHDKTHDIFSQKGAYKHKKLNFISMVRSEAVEKV